MNTAEQLKMYLSQLSASQTERGQSVYKQALIKLKQAEENPESRAVLLKAVAKDLMLAIRKNRHSADPYAGMAYLQFLRQEPEKSLNFLDSALRLDPQHEIALSLKQRFQSAQAVAKQLPPVSDVAHSYDDLEHMIQDELAKRQGLILQPSANDADILVMAGQLDALNTLYLDLLHSVEQIEGHDETMPLHRSLVKLADMLERYRKVLLICEQFLLLQRDIEQSISLAMELIQLLGTISVPESLPQDFYRILECLYDACDAYADQLDVVERQALDISSVSGRYEKLALLVQVLQEHLDEL